jgi:hypothetical protein
MAERPATYRDIIAAEAKKARVPPELALAMVDVESGGRPDAVSPKGARGFFQLMPETAKELGVDPNDPIQNIRGGLTYFRKQLDAYGGDVNKALTAYNWGPGNVARGGQPPPETVDYIQRVNTRWNPQPPQRRTLGTPPPVAGEIRNVKTARPSDFGGPTLGQRAASGALSVLESFDPRTPAGRRNIAGGAGAAAAIGLTAGTAAPLVAIGAGMGGAAAGGMAAETGEQILGTAPPSATGILGAGAEQAAYEVGGQALTWPIRAVGRRVVGSQLVKRTAERFNTLLEGATEAVRGAREYAASALEGARSRAGERVAGAQAAKESGVARARTAAETGVTAERGRAAGLTQAVGERFETLGTPPPGGAVAAGRQAQGVITGPAKSARDQVGQQIEEAAKAGPPVDITALKAEAQRILSEEIRPPQEVFPRTAPEEIPGAGLLGNMPTGTPSQRAMAEAAQAALAAAREEQVQTTLKHPAMQVLGRILNAEDTVPFHEAHLFKRELDDAIGSAWDRSVKTRVTNITKTLRGTLRESLGGFAPYDAATAAYRAIAPLYTKGIAPQMQRVAREDPGAVVRLLNPKQVEKARMLRDLLIEQPGKVGQRAQGQAAWDAVRAAWTYDRVIKGSLDGLGQRLGKLDPEFANVMYDDVPGRTILQNLRLIASAFDEAVSAGEANIAQAIARGKAGVSAATQQGIEGVRTAKLLGAGETAAARRAGQTAVKEALTQKAVVGKEARRFTKSSLVRGKDTDLLPDVLRATALGPGSIWGALSLVKILRGPRAADLIEYAAQDSRTTQLLVRAFTGAEMGTAAANLLRLASAPLGDLVPPEPLGSPPPGTPGTLVGTPPPRTPDAEPLSGRAGIGNPPPG